jgi:predicted RNase H-like nuclease
MKSFLEFLEESMKPEGVSSKEKPGAVKALERCLIDAKKEGSKLDYDSIDKLMQKVCKDYCLTGQKLHNDFVNKNNLIPDKWIKKHDINESAAWQRSAGKDPKGGLNRKGIASYRAEHPGSHLSMAVTTKPSKLKAGSKAANRRKSFCARMSGMKKRLTSAATAHDPDSRINKSLRKWNC